MRVLSVDVGTTSVRAVVVGDDAAVLDTVRIPTVVSTPRPGYLEFDPTRLADDVISTIQLAVNRSGPVDAIGVANQRSSTVVWDRRTGVPIGPGLGWQDNRTTAECSRLARDHGIALLPSQTATKAAWLVESAGVRPDSVCIGTLDSWIAWRLTGEHVTDHTNAAMTGLFSSAGTWSPDVVALLGLEMSSLPRIVTSTGVIADTTALLPTGPLAALIGDQQASLVGQGCVHDAMAKLTVGTGAMLDVCTGDVPAALVGAGCFPIIAWSEPTAMAFGLEALALTAGACVEWLVQLGALADPADSDALAATVPDTGGVVFVPALAGLGTPHWNLAARGALFGLTRGTGRAHVVRAVLDGVAQRCAELADAAARDCGRPLTHLRIDGGMARNTTFVDLLARRSGRTIEVSAVTESTALGAALLAGVAIGVWPSLADASGSWRADRIVPAGDHSPVENWHAAIARADTSTA